MLVTDELWNAMRDRLIAFRRKLKTSYGFLLRYELNTDELVGGGGPWKELARRHAPVPSPYSEA